MALLSITVTVVPAPDHPIRHNSGLSNVACAINGTPLPAAYAGAQPQFPGLDQFEFLLSPSLQGARQVNVTVTADGKTSNTVTLVF